MAEEDAEWQDDAAAELVASKRQPQSVPLPPRDPRKDRSGLERWMDIIQDEVHRKRELELHAMPMAPAPPPPDTFDQRFDPAGANFDEMKQRLQYGEELRRQGVPSYALPRQGYSEYESAPVYRPPGGSDYYGQGDLQDFINKQTNKSLSPIDEDTLMMLQALQKSRRQFNI